MADFMSGLLGIGNEDDPVQRAKQAGLLGLGTSLLQAGAPSLTPTSLGAALGQGIMSGQQMSQQAMAQARQQQIQKEMMGAMGSGAQGGDVQARIDRLQKMALLDPKNATTYLKLAEQAQGKAPVFTGEAANQALNLFGTADVSKLSPEQRAQAIAAADRSRAAGAPRMSINTNDPTAVARELRTIVNDYSSQTKDAREIIKNYKVMENAVTNPSVAGDVSLVFSYFKAIDPQSTVREGEYDTIVNATSLPERVRNAVNRVKTGQKLSPEQRADLLNSARQNVQAITPGLENVTQNYRGFVSAIGGDPDKVIRNPLAGLNFTNNQQPPATAAPTTSAAPRRQRFNPATGQLEDVQ